MKVTLELPDDLVRSIKFRAWESNRKLKDVAADLLRRGLGEPLTSNERRRMAFPLIAGGHPAAPGEEITADRVAEILTSEDAER